MPVVPPIVVSEGWDVSFFASEEAVDKELEPWYPSDAEYRAFDSEGRKLELTVRKVVIPRRLIWDRKYEVVGVRAKETAARHADDLARLLREWLRVIGEAEAPANATLSELFERSDLPGRLET